MIIYILPEILTFFIAVFFLITAFRKVPMETTHKIGMFLSIVNIIFVFLTINLNGLFFYGTYKVDFFSQSIKLILAIGLFFVIFMADKRIEEMLKKNYSEFLFFLFIANLGMMMLSSALEFITLFLSLELSSYTMFVLVGFLKNRKISAEAGIKYLFIGAVSSAITLYGYSIIYSYFGDTSLQAMRVGSMFLIKDAILYIGFLFFLTAFFFKLAILPFSFWAPDVYQGASTNVTTYIATVSKVAGVAVLLRVFVYFFPIFLDQEKILILIAILTMTFGNLVAVQQKELKRLLAYSSIAQAGYMLVGMIMFNKSGMSSTLFYVTAYLVMNFTVFLVIDQVEKEKGSTELTALKGLSQRAPLLSLALLLALLSLGGVPPFVGFTGKWFIFSSAINKGYLTLVLIAFLNSVVSVYYYLLVARQAYLFLPDESEKMKVTFPVRVYSYFSIIFIIVMGFYPAPLLNWAEKAIRYLVG